MRETDGKGDLGEVLEAMRPRLEHVVAVRLDPRLRRRIDPGDVIQAAFVEVVRRFGEWETMRARMPLFCWVRLMTLQKVAELHRRHLGTRKRDVRREGNGSIPESGSTMLTRVVADRDESPSRAFVRHEWEGALHQALERMKPVDREILVMRHFDRLSVEECARALGLTRAGAKVRHLRAARRLRRMLERADLPGDLATPARSSSASPQGAAVSSQHSLGFEA